MPAVNVDVHEHLWTDQFLEALRRRTSPPNLTGWTLHLDGEPPYEVRPDDHDLALREAMLTADGFDVGLVSLSAPLGIEWLPPDEAHPLLEAYHEGAGELPRHFASWAAACLTDLEPDRLAKELDAGCIGLQLPATAMASPAALERCGPLLEVLQEHDRPLFVHPGAVGWTEGAQNAAWWPALVPYVAQMHAAWYAFLLAGRELFPDLRVCFAMLAGLAPAHLERFAARGGERRPVDRLVFLETSSYGVTAIDTIVRAVGVDAVVLGSDRPYAAPFNGDVGSALSHAIRSVNPQRLLGPKGI
ncbi:MAG: 6-methylsalicylate decarboxylase [Frankiales bacterium]|nr:6-methylsalicylate decarboxylase [Frankiales bacterium]